MATRWTRTPSGGIEYGMGQRVTIVDAFTASPFSGNPAAVCVLGHPTTEAWMQSVAREMGQSETAFCVPLRDGQFELRWFTPACEVALCGHATLATAHTLWEEGRLAPRDSARFSTQSGNLIAAPLGRQIRTRFSVATSDRVRSPARVGGRSRGHPALGRPRRRRLPRSRRVRERRTELFSGLRIASSRRDARRHRDGGERQREDRLRVALLCATGGHRRRPCHRIGPLRVDTVLG